MRGHTEVRLSRNRMMDDPTRLNSTLRENHSATSTVYHQKSLCTSDEVP